jgi:hypothetical protein
MRRSSRCLCACIAFVAILGMAGCGKETHRSAWCDLALKRQAVFNTQTPLDPKALAAFGVVARQAPPAIRPDMQLVHRDGVLFWKSDKAFRTNATEVAAFVAAIGRVDKYLRTSCGADVPLPNKGQNS